MNQKLYIKVLQDTLDKKAQWLATDDPFHNALCYMLKELHKKGLLLSSGEFSLYRITQDRRRIAA